MFPSGTLLQYKQHVEENILIKRTYEGKLFQRNGERGTYTSGFSDEWHVEKEKLC